MHKVFGYNLCDILDQMSKPCHGLTSDCFQVHICCWFLFTVAVLSSHWLYCHVQSLFCRLFEHWTQTNTKFKYDELYRFCNV